VSPRLSLSLDEDLKQRETARQQVAEARNAEARRTLTQFIREYPLAEADTRKLRQLSLGETDIDALRAAPS
jgi:hypothetical protein